MSEPTHDELHLTLCDALAGWKYIRESHGDLYGVGWDRVQARLEKQIAISSQRIKDNPQTGADKSQNGTT